MISKDSWQFAVLSLFPYRYAVDKFRECDRKVRLHGELKYPDYKDIRFMLRISMTLSNLDYMRAQRITRRLCRQGYSKFWKYFDIKPEAYYNGMHLHNPSSPEDEEIQTKTRAKVVLSISTRSKCYCVWQPGAGQLILKLYRDGKYKILA